MRSTEAEHQSLSWGEESQTYSCLWSLDVKSPDCFLDVFDNAFKSGCAGLTGSIDKEAKVNAGSANWWLREIRRKLSWYNSNTIMALRIDRSEQTNRQHCFQLNCLETHVVSLGHWCSSNKYYQISTGTYQTTVLWQNIIIFSIVGIRGRPPWPWTHKRGINNLFTYFLEAELTVWCG